jgi:RND family efflux transporter MFP subunit
VPYERLGEERMDEAQVISPPEQRAPERRRPAPPPGHGPGEDFPGRGGLRPNVRGRARRVVLTAAVVLLAALAVVAYGIMERRHHEASLVKETDAAAVPTVAVAEPERGTGPRDLVLPGDVEAYFDAPIYARVSGYLKKWSYDIGAHVKKGDALATIETPELDEQLDEAKGELAVAQANLALAQVTAKRWKALVATNSVSQQSVDEKQSNALAQDSAVAAQKAHVQRLLAMQGFKTLAAPFDGVVTARNTDIGALINQGSSNSAPPLFKVADTHEMRVYVRVPQSYASQLQPGLKATLSEPQYPGVTFPATLATTSNAVALESRTVLVELIAPNPDGKLWPGTYAEVSFHLGNDASVLKVPASALIFREHGAQLAILGPNDTIQLKNVTIGRNLGTHIEILSGIGPDDKVVTAPPDTLQDGEVVQVASAPDDDKQSAEH